MSSARDPARATSPPARDVMQARWGTTAKARSSPVAGLRPGHVRFHRRSLQFGRALAHAGAASCRGNRGAHARRLSSSAGRIRIVNRITPQEPGHRAREYLPYGHAQVPPMAIWGQGNPSTTSAWCTPRTERHPLQPKVHFENVAAPPQDETTSMRIARISTSMAGRLPPPADLLRLRGANRDRRRRWRPANSGTSPSVHPFKTLLAVSREPAVCGPGPDLDTVLRPRR